MGVNSLEEYPQRQSIQHLKNNCYIINAFDDTEDGILWEKKKICIPLSQKGLRRLNTECKHFE